MLAEALSFCLTYVMATAVMVWAQESRSLVTVMMGYVDALREPPSPERDAVITLLKGRLAHATGDVGLAAHVANDAYLDFLEDLPRRELALDAYWTLVGPARASGNLNLVADIAETAYCRFARGSPHKIAAAECYVGLVKQLESQGDLQLAVQMAERACRYIDVDPRLASASVHVYWSLYAPVKAGGNLDLALEIANLAYTHFVEGSPQKRAAAEALRQTQDTIAARRGVSKLGRSRALTPTLAIWAAQTSGQHGEIAANQS